MNGTRGTDHRTGGCAFLAGGAVRGGRVIADWPGLARRCSITATFGRLSIYAAFSKPCSTSICASTQRLSPPESSRTVAARALSKG